MRVPGLRVCQSGGGETERTSRLLRVIHAGYGGGLGPARLCSTTDGEAAL